MRPLRGYARASAPPMTPAPPLPPPVLPAAPPAGPALWNPVAAAAWSILFTPLFGAILVAANWRALGQPARAGTQRWWMLGTVGLLVALLWIHFAETSEAWDILLRFGAFALLAAWIIAGAWPQISFLREHPPAAPVRRRWVWPVILGGAGLALFIALNAFTSGLAKRDTAEQAIASVIAPLTEALRQKTGQEDAEVQDFRLERQRDGTYRGALVLKSEQSESRWRVRARFNGSEYEWDAKPE